MINIATLDFNEQTSEKLKSIKNGTNWPVVYILNNGKDAYVGETTNASSRMNQHYANEIKRSLKQVNIITDETFNKSSILDLESFLIKYMSADNKYELLNGNAGLQNHNYYQREMYENKFKNIWANLKRKGLVKNELLAIENSDLFKYSPYKSLTEEQYFAVNDILDELLKDIKNNKKSTFIVSGGAGTGKTILGIYMIKLLTESIDNKILDDEDEIEQLVFDVMKLKETSAGLKIGLVIPMDNLRVTLRRCFREIKGLSPKMVMSPNDVAKSEEIYDILIVDEAHRLRRRKNLTQYATFDKNNEKFGLGKDGTELDWILLKSKYQILFYDENQSIKPTDVRKERFDEILFNPNNHRYFLDTQIRCMLGGKEYIDYINEIFSDTPPTKKKNFSKYDIKIFDNVDDMVSIIKEKDKEIGLCRNIAGNAFNWKSKGEKLPMHITKKDVDDIISKDLCDIEIDGYKYIWNTKITDWINSPNSINEIGCIHTVQGFDLNYTGLIIGNDLKYDLEKEKLYVDKSSYFDTKGKADTTEEELLEYLLNIYSTMCVRGMKGTYLYVCDESLKEYLKRYI